MGAFSWVQNGDLTYVPILKGGGVWRIGFGQGGEVGMGFGGEGRGIIGGGLGITRVC